MIFTEFKCIFRTKILILIYLLSFLKVEAKFRPIDSTNLSRYLMKGLNIQVKNLSKAESMLDSASKVIFKSDDNFFKGWAMMIKTSLMVSKGEYDSAERYAKLSRAYYEKVHDYEHVLAVNTNLAVLLYARSRFFKAFETINENIKIFKKSKDLDSFILVVNYDYLARILSSQKNFKEALKYQKLNLAYYKSFGKNKYNNLLLSYVLIGTTYSDYGLKDSALYYYNIVLKEAIKTEDNRLVINAATDLALVLYDLNRFKEAEYYVKLAKNYFDKYPDKRLIGYNQIISSKIACKLNHLQLARQEAFSALNIGKQIKNFETQKDANEALYKVFRKFGKHDSALYYLEAKMKIEDSLNNAAKQNLIIELNGLYKNEKIESELNAAKASLLSKDLILKKAKVKNQFTLLISIIVISILSFVIYIKFIRRMYSKNIEDKKRKIEIIEAKLTGQEEERQRISKDLHDSVVNDLMVVLYGLKGNSLQMDDESLQTKLVEINESIRRISHDLLPEKFKNENLEEMLLQLIKTHIKVFGWDISFDFNIGETDLNLTRKIELVKITQELFNNVIKHSDANKLKIKLDKQDGIITFTFMDNGMSYDFDRINNSGGINNINERTKKINAEIHLKRDARFNIISINIK